MKKEQIVIIGMGFLATYIIPCYENLLGEDIRTNVIGIKGSERGLKEKQAECSFPVIVGKVRETLEERRPDIIILTVKPNQIGDMTEGTLVPYYQMLREKGEKLPDLYSFAPDPSVDYFYNTLGADVNAANMIPNMVRKIKEYNVSETGVSFVSFDSRRQWPSENRKRALAFMEPTGTVVEVDGDKAIPFLSSQCACHLMFEFNYIAQDVQKELGKEVSLADCANMYRTAFRKSFDEECVKVIPCNGEGADKELMEFMELLMSSWRKGVLNFAESEKIPYEPANRLVCGSMETYQMEAQLEPKEVLVQNTKNHATPGGFLEMCLITFHKEGYEFITAQMKNWLTGKKEESVGKEFERIAFEVAKAISDHGKTVSGIKR
ncbi:MAG: hypothetical protein HFI63_06635 [Lachnospiraceae bacterium]|nr:hypothetical protein [Lachnospiraceae bacterium]